MLFFAAANRAQVFERSRKITSRLLAVALLVVLVTGECAGSPLSILVVELIGLSLVSIAVLGRIWCTLYIAGRKNAELCTDGPYSLCRNPLYVFSFLGVVGLTFVARAEQMVLLIAPAFWVYHHYVIRSEEIRLASVFGEAYNQYCREVPRVLPRIRGFWSRTNLSINPRIVTRSLTEVAWFLVALGGLEIVEHLRGASFYDHSLPTLVNWPF